MNENTSSRQLNVTENPLNKMDNHLGQPQRRRSAKFQQEEDSPNTVIGKVHRSLVVAEWKGTLGTLRGRGNDG